MADLIILDVYGTILRSDTRRDAIRPGLIEFLDFYKHKPEVVFSDADRETILFDLSKVGLVDKFDGIYDRSHCTNGLIKNLSIVCNDAGIKPENTVFIGDNYFGREQAAAKKYGVKFIKVPQFRLNPPESFERCIHEEYTSYEDLKNPFTFKSLIGNL